jgi:hypothetical protein
MFITKRLGVQTKRSKVLVSYDFHFEISNEKEDVMFTTKLYLFSIGTITIPTHIEPIYKLTCILDLSIVVPKQHVELVELVCVLVVNLVIFHLTFQTTLT